LDTDNHDSRLLQHLVMLSMASLFGMVVVMAVIIWQMHDNVMTERQRTIQSQVISALGITEAIYKQYRQGLIGENEAKLKVQSFLSLMKYPGGGYFWVIDHTGTMLMHPYDSKLVGENLLDLHDVKGHYFVRSILETSRTGGGFVRYQWPRPTGGDPIPKISYVTQFEPWNWSIGSGIFIHDLRVEALRQITFGGVLIFVLFSINLVISLHLSRRFMHEYRDSAIRDVLTGLYTRRYLDEIGPRLIERSQMDGKNPLVAIFLDIDHFKQINDDHGHKVGDKVLQVVGKILKSHIRPNEMAFRYGGEELVLLVQESMENSRNIAERIRNAVNQHVFTTGEQTFDVTLSAGISVCGPETSIHELLRNADECMYRAKSKGRNCVVTEFDPYPSIDGVVATS